MTDKERWEDPKSRAEIEQAIKDSPDTLEMIRALLWATEGTPWHYLAIEKAQAYRVKVFLDNVPRFV